MSNSLTRKGLLAAILLATVLLTAGYLLGQLWLQVPVVFLVGILWGVCVLRDIRWVASLLFVVMMGAAAIGYMAHLSHILMLAAGCASVIAWDLHQFEGRLLDLDEPATKEMEKQHLLRSLMVLGISFLVIAVDSMLHIRIPVYRADFRDGSRHPDFEPDHAPGSQNRQACLARSKKI